MFSISFYDNCEVLKRILSATILITTLVSPAIITIGTIEAERYLVRQDIKHLMMQGISKDRLQLIKITPDESDQLDWEHSQEFEYKSEMFDVVYQEFKNDTSYYWCWWDHRESSLNRELSQLLHNTLSNRKTNNENNIRLIILFKSLYSEALASVSCAAGETTNQQPICGYLANYSSTYLDTQNPPPEV